jgi:hypothetical protein
MIAGSITQCARKFKAQPVIKLKQVLLKRLSEMQCLVDRKTIFILLLSTHF